MSPAFLSIVSFAAAAFAAAAAASVLMDLFLRDKLRIDRRLAEKFGDGSSNTGRRSSLFKDLKLMSAETSRPGTNLWLRYQAFVEQSGLKIVPLRLILICVVLAGACGIAVGAISESWITAAAATITGAGLPILYVRWRRKMRIEKLCQQLVGAFELMSRAVRAGQTMSAAMQLGGAQTKPPLSHEFSFCCEQQSLGLSPAVALKNLARRTAVIELELFVVAMLVQRQAGGNPVEVLDSLKDVIRKRIKLRAKVKALTSEGRLQAIVLSVLPAVALVALRYLNPSYAQVLFDRPYLLGGILAFQALGALWIRKIVNFDF